MATPANLLKGWARVVANAKPDPLKRITISDPDTRGLYVRITPKGAKTWTIVARDPAGKQVWREIGPVDEYTLEEARQKAREGVKLIKQGEEPFPAPMPKKIPDTFKFVAENFIDRHVKKQGLRTAPETERIFKKYVYPEWNKAGEERAFLSIKRGDVSRLLDKIEDENGAVMATRVLAVVSKLFNWYASREDDYSSPIVRGMGRANSRDRARKRILSDDDIRAIWKACGDLGTFGAFVRTCLLTGQRRAKVAAMRWGDIQDGVWTIPAEAREKVNAGELKLPKQALEIINAQPVIEKNPYVFAGRGKKAMAGFSVGKRDLDEKAPLQEPWVLHDLRRTAKSLMARANVRPDISERVLGHVIAGVEGVYDRHSYAAEKADALEKLASLVDLILNPPKGNVVELRQA
ncbi:hypothetical protein BSL82_05005 [Tardibacter chloracetimidivorans]|uniref:Tyr recombinase domain-containing protein n=1 Tax=Tardibacter chloracetimidivorans TaxID=1921510 RepID=A0A1L3ZSY9_9SPHN|nr:site-specific integrase [Tardibacter chloracetimidivorans]API58753.1 hypothetical protein BSL82_05005 [Tardibacter chloracetimidivorans]